MQGFNTVRGADGPLNWNSGGDGPSTWDITLRLERHPKYYPDGKSQSDFKTWVYRDWSEKSTALGISRIKQSLPQDILELIKSQDPWVARRLGLKLDQIEEFPFKVLVEGTGEPEKVKDSGQVSYLCLSYRWWSAWATEEYPGWPALSPALKMNRYTNDRRIPPRNFPISDCMWHAFVSERNNENEGLWVDQLCINQNDAHEVQNAVSCMDIVYMKSRKVVVVLEDVLLWSDEARCLMKYAETINAVPLDERKSWSKWTVSANQYVLGASAAALYKIEGSHWFRRVWCSHELRTGEEFLFMVPITERELPTEGPDSVCILKFDCKALATLIHASRTMNKGTKMRTSEMMRIGYMHEVALEVLNDNQARLYLGSLAAPDHELFTPEILIKYRAQHMNAIRRPLIQELAEIIVFQDQNPRDLLTILLNFTYIGISYNSDKAPTLPEVVWITNVIALAIGDASPLMAATRLENWQGKQIEGIPSSKYSWAAFPSPNEQTRLLDLTKFGPRLDLKLTDKGIKLLVAVINRSENIKQLPKFPGTPLTFIADVLRFDRKVIQLERMAEIQCYGKDLETIEEIPLTYLQHFVDAFIAIHCGTEDWVDKCTDELMDYGLLARDLNIKEAIKAYWELPESWLDLGTAEVGSDLFQRLRDLLPTFKPYIQFAEALVIWLIGNENECCKGTIDKSLVIGMISQNVNNGEMQQILVAAPCQEKDGFYWMVQQYDMLHLTNPQVIEAGKDYGMDFQLGGTWAIQTKGTWRRKEDSLKWWNEEKPGAKMGFLEPSKQGLPVTLLSRNIRMIPKMPWFNPIYTQTVVVESIA